MSLGNNMHLADGTLRSMGCPETGTGRQASSSGGPGTKAERNELAKPRGVYNTSSYIRLPTRPRRYIYLYIYVLRGV